MNSKNSSFFSEKRITRLMIGFAVVEVLIAMLMFETYSMGQSMSPTLEQGDILVCTRLKPFDFKDHIVVYEDITGTLIAHRCVKDNGEHIWTKGDANPVGDPYSVPKANVKGVGLFTTPFSLCYVMGGISFSILLLFMVYVKRYGMTHGYSLTVTDQKGGM